MRPTDLERRNWCFGETELAAAVRRHLRNGAAPAGPIELPDEAVARLVGCANPPDQPALRTRLTGLAALASAALTGNPAYLPAAVAAFDAELADPTTAAPPPADEVAAVFQAFGAAPVFAAADWTPGTFLAFDWLADTYGPRPPTVAESTPILTTANQSRTLLTLTVERRPGGAGVVVPDLWAMGLPVFGATIAGTRAALLTAGAAGRLRWRLELRHWRLQPTALFGRSGEVAAACCAHAAAERDPAGPPLLDPDFAVTGTLDGAAVGRVTERGFADKLLLAHEAGLLGVLHSADQPDVPKAPRVPLFPVATPAEAFDGLRGRTTDPLLAVRRHVAAAWAARHHRTPTP